MNYYEHHLGDYAQATLHLTFIEDAAYSRLLRKYYADEKPLPVEVRAVQRLAGARTEEEKQAVADVLSEFFELQEDGWHSKRCDEEIAKYREKQSKAKASADARWSKKQADAPAKQCERNANAMRTQCDEGADAMLTRHQTPDTNVASVDAHKTRAKSAVDIPGVPAELLNEWRKIRKADITQTVADGLLREAEKAGISAEQAVRTCCERVWRGFRADWLRDKSIKPDKPSRHSGFDEQNYRDLGAFA